jgi:hypothetical protein
LNNREKYTFKEWVSYLWNITWKVRIARIQIKWREKRKKIFTSKKPEINSMQKRTIELFSTLLKNKNTTLNHSPESKIRFIESDFLWLTMSVAGNMNYLINIIDESVLDDAHSHEVYIPTEYAHLMMDDFDLELEKRFRAMEAAKKRVVVDEIDKLIKKIQEEK